MNAKRYRHKVTIQRSSESIDGYGGAVPTWSTYKVIWAEVKPLQGREYYQSQQINSEVTHSIKSRWLSGITPKMRAVWGSRTFDIQSVINLDERGEVVEIRAIER